MANFKYFADLNGETIEFSRVDHRGGKAGTWGYSAAHGEWLRVTRSVEYKQLASKHVCDARCVNATGRIMKCECSCGGKNHGKGSFNCTAEAA